jgi:hypothetical protein
MLNVIMGRSWRERYSDLTANAQRWIMNVIMGTLEGKTAINARKKYGTLRLLMDL